jgi:arylsulfatase
MLGTRGIWHRGWKAATEHGPLPSNIGNFDKDRWQLFNTDADRSEAVDLADKHPDKVKELSDLWLEQANKYKVLPLNDLSVFEFIKLEYHVEVPASGRFVYYPGTTEVPEASVASTHGRSFKIFGEVEFTPQSKGVICAQGSRFGGYSLFVKEGNLYFVYNFLGVPPEQQLTGAAPTSGKHVVGVEFSKKKQGATGESLGMMKLYVGDEVIAKGEFRTMTGRYSLCGEGLCIGYDGGDAVSQEYQPKFPFTGGKVLKVIYDLADDQYVDVERKFAEALARD